MSAADATVVLSDQRQIHRLASIGARVEAKPVVESTPSPAQIAHGWVKPCALAWRVGVMVERSDNPEERFRDLVLFPSVIAL